MPKPTSERLTIGMILDNEFTGDLRVENEVRSLVENDFNVIVLCFNHGKKEDLEDFHGAQIVRIRVSKFFKNKTKALVTTPLDIYTSFWARQIVTFVDEYQIEALHIHDLYLLGAAFKANKRLTNNLPIIADLHENYPEALKYYKFSQTFPGSWLISIPKWERKEKEWVHKADYLITVIDEAKERYAQLGVDKKKIHVVANYVDSGSFLNDIPDQSIIKKYEDAFALLYVGGFDLHRGLENVIRTVAVIRDEIPNLRLVLVGAGSNLEDLKSLAQSLKVADIVDFEGWQPPSSLPSYIKASSVCLIPHIKTGHTDNTIPHKLFQYMLLERAVLSTNCDPIERILLDTNAGEVYLSEDQSTLASAILSMSGDSERLAAYGINGKEGVQKKYNWQTTAANLIALYDKVELAQR